MTAWGVKPLFLCDGAGGAAGRTCEGVDAGCAVARVACGVVDWEASDDAIVVAALRTEMYIVIED